MGVTTAIAWTDHTFNIAWGCFKVSAGCANCYADTFSARQGHKIWGPAKTTPRRTFGEKHWNEPLRWQKAAAKLGDGLSLKAHRLAVAVGVSRVGYFNRAVEQRATRMVFSSSMCDVCEDHPTIIAELRKLWPLIRATPNLHWQLLTKRPERYLESLPADWGEGYPNVWLGTSIEDMRVAWRADELRAIPAAVRFFSYEPALGPLDDIDLTGIDWVIYGGESGAGYRAHDLAWPRAMRAKCDAAGVAFFYKQSAAPRTEMGTTLDGETVRHFPVPRITVPLALPLHHADGWLL